MRTILKNLEKRILQIEEIIDPKPKLEIRFTLNEDEIDESNTNVIWVYWKL